MKKKLPTAPVRAKVRGTRDVQATSTVTVWPGATAAGSGTDSTVWSAVLPSSGAMNVAPPVRSARGAAPPASRRIAVTSMKLQSACGRSPGESA